MTKEITNVPIKYDYGTFINDKNFTNNIVVVGSIIASPSLYKRYLWVLKLYIKNRIIKRFAATIVCFYLENPPKSLFTSV